MGTIGTNIIYSIGSVGSAKTVAAFAAIGFAVGAVTAKLNELQKAGEKYRRLQSSLTIDMDEYNKSTHAMIDTMAGLEGAVKLQNSGAKVTALNMSAIGKAAIVMNKQLGNEPGGATEVFNQLVKSITRGSDRALKPFGIQLKETEDLAKAQAEMLVKLTAKFGDLTVEVETTREALFALDNNIGTSIDQFFAWGGEAIPGATDALGSMNKVLENSTNLMDKTQGHLYDLDNAFGVIAFNIANAAAKLKDFLSLAGMGGLISQSSIDKLSTFSGTKIAQALEQGAADKKKAAAKNKALGTQLGRGGRGRGGGGRGGDTMTITEEDIFRSEGLDLLDTGPAKDSGGFGGGIDPDAELDELEQSRFETLSQGESNILYMKLDMWEQTHTAEQHYAQASADMWEQSFNSKMGMMAGFTRQMSVLMQAENEKMFKIGKAFAVANTIFETYAGAQKAFTSLAGIPVVGPALGAMAAAAAITAGMMRVKQIAKTKPGSASAMETGARGSFGGGMGGGPIAGSGYNENQGATGGTTTVVLNLDGQQIHEAVVSQNNNAQQQGREAFAAAS